MPCRINDVVSAVRVAGTVSLGVILHIVRTAADSGAAHTRVAVAEGRGKRYWTDKIMIVY